MMDNNWITRRLEAIKLRERLSFSFLAVSTPAPVYDYDTRLFSDLSMDEIQECSELFSNHYGIYNNDAPEDKRGKRIRFGVRRYVETYKDFPTAQISTCRIPSRGLIGFVIFITGELKDNKKYCWVTSLVVHGDYRQRGIGTKLLESAWCFSDYDIRGLATANAITLRTLEHVTWRRIEPKEIAHRVDDLLSIIYKVPFMSEKKIVIGEQLCQIDTDFFPEQEASNHAVGLREYEERLGRILKGHEWFGMIFNEQPVLYDKKRFDKYVAFSEEKLFEAFSRELPNLAYLNAGARAEVGVLIEEMVKEIQPNWRILDLGCGKGRHCIELAEQGYRNVVGVDMLEIAIFAAEESAKEKGLPIKFYSADVRYYRDMWKYDMVLCLYDVIGTYRDEKDNDKILDNIRDNLKMGGIAVMSVMNMALTEIVAGDNKFSISAEPERLLNLPATRNMQTTGEVFHKDIIINEDDGLVYRKEQFVGEHGLNAEYIITDKRYTRDEFTKKLKKKGFEVLSSRFVRAKRWHEELNETNKNAKEILFVVRKEIKLF